MERILHCNKLLSHTKHLSFFGSRHIHLAYPVHKQTHYEVLGVSKEATKQEIRDAFVKRSKEIHPDLNPDDPETHEKFVLVNEAYNVLSKVKSRRDYDEMLRQPQRAEHTGTYYHGPGTAPGGFYSEFYHPSSAQTDSHTDDKWSYYGIKGIKRKSNAEVATFAIAAIMLGAIAYLITGLLTWKLRKKHEDEVYKENQRIYDEVRANAGRFTSAEQLENYILQHQQMITGTAPKPSSNK